MAISSSHRFSFLTGAPPERVWAALTCPDTTPRFLHGMRLESAWVPGSPVELQAPAGHSVSGEAIRVDPPRSLSFALEQGTAPCRIIGWELRPHPEGTVVRLSIDDVDGDCEEEVEDVWLPVVAALQGLLDTPAAGD
ncbi:MAG TPA: SRPBCC domain-containing protein [Acidimicrobiales bacterium]|jgi:uncharacterized protein YndB with AHSA1/START domain